MTHPCIAPEQFEDVESLPDGHPARLHLRECARCRARHRAYRSFMEDARGAARNPQESDADSLRHERTLQHFGLSREVPDTDREPSGPWWRTWMQSARARWLVVTPTVAAAAIVAALFVASRHPADESHVYRGPVSAYSWGVEPATLLSDGGIRLTWRRRSGADAYSVRLLDTALATVYRTGDLADTTIVLDPGALGPAARSGAHLLWRVTAFRGGESLEETDPGILQLP